MFCNSNLPETRDGRLIQANPWGPWAPVATLPMPNAPMGASYTTWRDTSVDHEGEVLESFVTKRRDRKAALRFLKKSMKRFGAPKMIVTDRLRSYRAAMSELGNMPRQETGRWLNNRAENSHLPFRRRGWIHISSATFMFSRKASAGVLNPRHFLGVELMAHVNSLMSSRV